MASDPGSSPAHAYLAGSRMEQGKQLGCFAAAPYPAGGFPRRRRARPRTGPVSSGVTTALSDAVDALARAGAMVVEVHGEHLKIDAPAGMLTEEDRAALMEFKPKLLKFLSHIYEEPQEGPERARAWPAGQGLVQIRDPFTGEWHELPAAKSLPGVLAEADRRRKGGAG
jgi:hypothetical protein